MKALRRVEVEPLSEQRWAKIERSVFAELELEGKGPVTRAEPRRPASGLARWLIAASLAALAAVAFTMRGLPGDRVIDSPSRIATGTNASHLALPGLSLDVEPQSAVVVQAETARGTLIVLDRGTIVCEVAPRSSEAPLIVQAGATHVRVLGTRFSVTRLGEGAEVAVQRGVVEVTSRGESWRVSAGEKWPRTVGSRPGESPGASTPVPAASETSTPHRPEATLEKEDPERAGTARRRSSSRARPDREESETVVAQPEQAVPAGQVEPEVEKAEPATSQSQPSRQVLFEQATALERSDPTRASELYRSLESRNDSWAQNALYARGRLAASRGNASEARRLLEQYLQRFPNGGNAEDARAVLRRLR